MKKIAVAMSGGVDSSVVAYLMKSQGHKVVGIFMKNWDDSLCNSTKDYEDALLVSQHLNIPLYSFNFSEKYKELVFNDFVKGLKNGITPNPDILCNKLIKFGVLLNKSLSLGMEMLATGHYSRIDENYNLLKGIDSSKDQSYFLYTLNKYILRKVLFPLGGLLKRDVRVLARDIGLPNNGKKDSVGICFIGKRKFKDFISSYIASKKGLIKTMEGEVLGDHNGLWFYTIGQRCGIGGNGPWYVVEKNVENGDLIVVNDKEDSRLFNLSLLAGDLHWVNGPPKTPLRCKSKIRYGSKDIGCVINKIEDGKALMEFEEPNKFITPGQSVVCYLGDQCLGGGIILKN